MDIKRVKPRRLYEDILEQLYQLIHDSDLSPGDAFPPERDLAEQFGVSRGTLREAFRILEKEGLIRSTPGGGRYISEDMHENSLARLVRTFEDASIRDLYEVREILETAIAGLAARRAGKEDIEELESFFRSTAEDLHNVGTSDQYFHLSLASATHNILMADMIKVNLGIIEKNKSRKYRYSPERTRQIIEEHRDILDAIKSQDPDAAMDRMRHHLRMGYRNITRPDREPGVGPATPQSGQEE